MAPPKKPAVGGKAKVQDFCWMPFAALRPWNRNPRLNDRAVEPVARSIARFGFIRPITVWLSQDRMVAGHTALRSFQRIIEHGFRGADGQLVPPQPSFCAKGAPGPGLVPVRFHEFDSEAEADAYAIADNKLGEIAEWDEAMVAALVAEQMAADRLLPKLAGFSDFELVQLLKQGDAGSEADDEPVDATAELQAKWQTEYGQIWEIPSRTTPGRVHRLMCGNSEKIDEVDRLRAGVRWLLMVTDPPYGVNYDPSWRDELNRDHPNKLTGTVTNDDRFTWTTVYKLYGADVGYIWHPGLHGGHVQVSVEDAGYKVRAQILWRKQQAVLSRGHYHWQHEPCLYAVREGSRSGWCGDRAQSTCWDITSLNPRGGGGRGDDAPMGHGTQKPIECFRRPMRNHHGLGSVIVDPFHGSGTALLAAEREGRICYAMELEPRYLAQQLERVVLRLGLEPRRL